MKDRIKISFIILCLLAMTQNAYCASDNNNQKDLDVGKSIFKKEKKAKKIKVKPEKVKKQYKVTDKVLKEYSIPTDVYMNVGEITDKTLRLEGGVTKSVELNLADCLELALINNPKIKSAYHQSEMAKYQKWETLSGYSPRLDFSTSINHQKPDLSMIKHKFPSMTAEAYDKYVLGQIGIRQLVWDFGFTQNKYTIDKINYEQSKANIDKIVNEVVCNVKDSYYNLMYAFNQKKVAKETLDNYTKTFHQATAFYEVGSKAKVDVLFAQTNMEEARSQLIAAENNLDIAYSRLNNALGLPFSDPYMIDNTLVYEPVSITMKEAVEIANSSRPDIKSGMLNVDKAEQNVKLAWKTVMPSIELQANVARGGVDTWADTSWYNYGGVLAFPTFNPLLLRNQVKEAKAQYQQVQYSTKAQINDIYYEIQTVYTRLKDAKARIPVAKLAMEKAQENYDLTSGRYKVGYGDVIELKDAQVNLANSKMNYYQTIYQYNSARANLEKSIGQTIKPDSSEVIDNSQDI